MSTQPIYLYYSKMHAGLLLALMLAMALWCGYIVLAGLLAGNIVLLVAGGASLLVLSPILLTHVFEPVRAFRSKSAVVILDERGITDSRKKNAFLDWTTVSRVALGKTQKSRGYLIFELSGLAGEQRKSGGAVKLFLRRAFLKGDWNVNLRPLKCDPAQVLKAATQMHLVALRRRAAHRATAATPASIPAR